MLIKNLHPIRSVLVKSRIQLAVMKMFIYHNFIMVETETIQRKLRGEGYHSAAEMEDCSTDDRLQRETLCYKSLDSRFYRFYNMKQYSSDQFLFPVDEITSHTAFSW